MVTTLRITTLVRTTPMSPCNPSLSLYHCLPLSLMELIQPHGHTGILNLYRNKQNSIILAIRSIIYRPLLNRDDFVEYLYSKFPWQASSNLVLYPTDIKTYRVPITQISVFHTITNYQLWITVGIS